MIIECLSYFYNDNVNVNEYGSVVKELINAQDRNARTSLIDDL